MQQHPRSTSNLSSDHAIRRKRAVKFFLATLTVVIVIFLLGVAELLEIRKFFSNTVEQNSRSETKEPACNATGFYTPTSLALRQSHELYELFTGPEYENLTEWMENWNTTTTTASTTVAACEWWIDKYSDHLPHAMQQLYRCFSWWRSFPEKDPILITEQSLTSPFVKGFVAALEEVFGVTMVTPDDHDAMDFVSPFIKSGIKDTASRRFAVHAPEDLLYLRDMTLHFYDISLNEGGCSNLTRGSRAKRLPRISILNRESKNGRTLLMLHQLEKSITERTGAPVSTFYFEDRTFLEQVQLMAQSDILISPHGAQLTALPYMPNCGALLEIFPLGYFMPRYFGSLAAASGLAYFFHYTGTNLTAETEFWMKDLDSRTEARSRAICPNIDLIVNATIHMISDWENCCDRTA